MKNLNRLFLAILFLAFATAAYTQEPAAKQAAANHFYRLAFQVQELDGSGKLVNTRSYTTTIAAVSGPPSDSIRTGSKIPVKTSDKGDLQYLDVGVNIDTRDPQENEGKLSLFVTASVSSLAAAADNVSSSPIIRQNQWSSWVIVPMGRPTVIFSSDHLEDKGRSQLELTATRVE